MGSGVQITSNGAPLCERNLPNRSSGPRLQYSAAGIIVAAMLSGCAGLNYARIADGTLAGNLDVRWVHNDCFLFIPDDSNPLRFVRSTSGESVQPRRRMYTDGGSIPRVLWAMPQFSPWGYAPAYIIHDWLFEAHRCDEQFDRVTFEESARILAEVMKAQMEADPRIKDVSAHYLIYKAVSSPIARRLWDDPRECDIPPDGVSFMHGSAVLQVAPVVLRVRDGRAVPADGPIVVSREDFGSLSAGATLGLEALKKVCGSRPTAGTNVD